MLQNPFAANPSHTQITLPQRTTRWGNGFGFGFPVRVRVRGLCLHRIDIAG